MCQNTTIEYYPGKMKGEATASQSVSSGMRPSLKLRTEIPWQCLIFADVRRNVARPRRLKRTTSDTYEARGPAFGMAERCEVQGVGRSFHTAAPRLITSY